MAEEHPEHGEGADAIQCLTTVPQQVPHQARNGARQSELRMGSPLGQSIQCCPIAWLDGGPSAR
eukprot:scaffold1105_cov633-Prasinococcus_capsulatus_cf.AAC.1